MKNNNEQLSKDFQLKEFCYSRDYPQYLDDFEFTEMQRIICYIIANTLLQPARDYLNLPIKIDSGIRTEALHYKIYEKYPDRKIPQFTDHFYRGYSGAVDITCEDNHKLFTFLENDCMYGFGQLIKYLDDTAHINLIHISIPTIRHRYEICQFYKGAYRKLN